MRALRWYLVLLGKTVIYRSSSKKFAQQWADDFNSGLPDDSFKAIVIQENQIATS